VVAKKVYIPDGGSLVIDRSQVLWHTAGHYSLLVEMDDQPSMIFAGDFAEWRRVMKQAAYGGHTRR
jgi:glyoxylase-like metal-dependent hydrolase (beta-lactamase superfamily II)